MYKWRSSQGKSFCRSAFAVGVLILSSFKGVSSEKVEIKIPTTPSPVKQSKKDDSATFTKKPLRTESVVAMNKVPQHLMASPHEMPKESLAQSNLKEKTELSHDKAPTVEKEGTYVILQGLNKITARVFTFKAPVGEVLTFQNLRIIPHFCQASPPEDPPETTVFLEIHEETKDKGVQKVFEGWMFASSPSTSALEHPIYDVWVKGAQVVHASN